MAFYPPITDTTGTAVTMSPAAIADSEGSGPSATGYGLHTYSGSPLSSAITRTSPCDVGNASTLSPAQCLHHTACNKSKYLTLFFTSLEETI